MQTFLKTSVPKKVSTDEIAAGLRAFFEIMKVWGVGNDQAMVLLGQPARPTFFKWKRNEIGSSAHSYDLATRLSYILGIFKSLEILYRDPKNADRWVTAPNLAFGGESALDRMMSGQITDLALVRDYLDTARGGW
ncbi:MAG: DUF2384 domain-containing protein [Proteobacteria bacterium]|nr:DUF2384 domain-containing protein [Pseudomonadota bacterium]